MCLEDVLDDLDGGGWCQVSQTGACQTATSPFLPKKGPSHHHNKKKWDRSEWSASTWRGTGSGVIVSEKLSICLTGYSYFLHQNFLRLLYAKPSSRRSLLRNPNIENNEDRSSGRLTDLPNRFQPEKSIRGQKGAKRWGVRGWRISRGSRLGSQILFFFARNITNNLPCTVLRLCANL